MKNLLKVIISTTVACCMLYGCSMKCPTDKKLNDSSCSCINPNNNYANTDTTKNEISSADIFIDKLDVIYDPSNKNYIATIMVSNYNDDNAQDAMLIVTLPIESTLKNVELGPHSKHWEQCGGIVRIYLGELGVCGCTTDCQRMVKITVSKIKNSNYIDHEAITAFVYSSSPDICPNNNYKTWLKIPGRCPIPCTH